MTACASLHAMAAVLLLLLVCSGAVKAESAHIQAHAHARARAYAQAQEGASEHVEGVGGTVLVLPNNGTSDCVDTATRAYDAVIVGIRAAAEHPAQYETLLLCEAEYSGPDNVGIIFDRAVSIESSADGLWVRVYCEAESFGWVFSGPGQSVVEDAFFSACLGTFAVGGEMGYPSSGLPMNETDAALPELLLRNVEITARGTQAFSFAPDFPTGGVWHGLDLNAVIVVGRGSALEFRSGQMALTNVGIYNITVYSAGEGAVVIESQASLLGDDNEILRARGGVLFRSSFSSWLSTGRLVTVGEEGDGENAIPSTIEIKHFHTQYRSVSSLDDDALFAVWNSNVSFSHCSIVLTGPVIHAIGSHVHIGDLHMDSFVTDEPVIQLSNSSLTWTGAHITSAGFGDRLISADGVDSIVTVENCSLSGVSQFASVSGGAQVLLSNISADSEQLVTNVEVPFVEVSSRGVSASSLTVRGMHYNPGSQKFATVDGGVLTIEESEMFRIGAAVATSIVTDHLLCGISKIVVKDSHFVSSSNISGALIVVQDIHAACDPSHPAECQSQAEISHLSVNGFGGIVRGENAALNITNLKVVWHNSAEKRVDFFDLQRSYFRMYNTTFFGMTMHETKSSLVSATYSTVEILETDFVGLNFFGGSLVFIRDCSLLMEDILIGILQTRGIVAQSTEDVSNITLRRVATERMYSLTSSGAILYKRGFGNILVDSCIFRSVQALIGGVFSVHGQILMEVHRSWIGKSASVDSGGVFEVSTGLELLVTNTRFVENTAHLGGVISVREDPIKHAHFENCTFRRMAATEGGIFFTDVQSTVSMVGCTVEDSSADLGGVFRMQAGSRVIVTDSVLTGSNVREGGVAYITESGGIAFVGSEISNMRAQTGAMIVARLLPTSRSLISFTHCELVNNRAWASGGMAVIVPDFGKERDSASKMEPAQVVMSILDCSAESIMGTAFGFGHFNAKGMPIFVVVIDTKAKSMGGTGAIALLRGDARLYIHNVTALSMNGQVVMRHGTSLTASNSRALSWRSQRLNVIETRGSLFFEDVVLEESHRVLIIEGVTEFRNVQLGTSGINNWDSVASCPTVDGGAVSVTAFGRLNWIGGGVAHVQVLRDPNAQYLKEGGAIQVAQNARVYLQDVVIEYCSAEVGGAIAAATDNVAESGHCYLTLKNCTLRHNSAQMGGALFIAASHVIATVSNCRFYNNTAKVYGGGMSVQAPHMLIEDTVFDSNSAYGTREVAHGGGASIIAANIEMRNVAFHANTAAGRGGGVAFLRGDYNATFTNVSFVSNSAVTGGGMNLMLGCNHTTTAYFNDVHFERNEAIGGGAVFIKNETANAVSSLYPPEMTFDSNCPALILGCPCLSNITSGYQLVKVQWEDSTMVDNHALYGPRLSSDVMKLELELDATEAHPGDLLLLSVYILDRYGNAVSGPALGDYVVEAWMDAGDLVSYIGATSFSEGNATVLPVRVTSVGESAVLSVHAFPPNITVNVPGFSRFGEEFPSVPLWLNTTLKVLPYCQFNHQLSTNSRDESICIVCDSNEYSLQADCLPCPDAQSCVRVSAGEYFLEDGLWASPPGRAERLYVCPREKACTEIICKPTDSHNDCRTQCARGYKDRMCSVCESSWFPSIGGCKECPSAVWSVVLYTVGILAWISSVGFGMVGWAMPQLCLLFLSVASFWVVLVVELWLVVFVLVLVLAFLFGHVFSRLAGRFEKSDGTIELSEDTVDELLIDSYNETPEADGESSNLSQLGVISTGTVECLLFFLQASRLMSQGGREVDNLVTTGLSALQLGGLECVFGVNDYILKFAVEMSQPVVIFLTCLCWGVAIWAFYYMREAATSSEDQLLLEDEMQEPIEGAFQTSGDRSRLSYTGSEVSLGIDLDKYTLKHWLTRAFSMTLLFTSITYFDLTQSILSVFACTFDEGSDRYYMSSIPSVECYRWGFSDEWGLLFWLSIPLVLVYVLGIPAVWTALLVIKYKRRELFSRETVSAFGFLFGTYRARLWLWHIVTILRLLVLETIAVFLWGRTSQEAAFTAVLLVILVLYDWTRPYNEKVSNYSSSISILVLLITQTFKSAGGSSVLMILIQVLNGATLLAFSAVIALPTLLYIRSLIGVSLAKRRQAHGKQ